ncbi:MAG: autotransporter-associated beta strand repeat-containing protein, partial [Planctomycetaceae bacterium]|nr:autotransporter-associated beta strand repeat-containing protein [Planctomycetaceae bacterium]
GNKDTTINGLNGNNGSVTKTGSGTTTLSGTNTYTGATIINNGILALTGNSSLEKSSAVTINSGTFDLSGVTTNTKVQDLQGSGNVELGNKNLSVGKGDFSGTINGNNGTLTKTGNDKLTLSGTNTYTGETNINGGMLALKDSGSIASSSKLTLANNTIFDLNEVTTSTSVQNLQGSGNVELGNKNLSVDKGDFNGTISGNDGTLTKTGIDTLTLSGTNIYTGETNIEDGTLALKNSGSIASSSKLTLANNSIFNISGISATSTNVQNLQGSGSVELGNKNISIDKGNFYGVINGTGTLTKTGIDTLTLSGTNTYSGATNINAGTLELFGSIDNTTEINVAAGTILKTQDTKKLNNLNSTGTVTFDNDLELAGNKDTTINGLNGTKNVAKTGTGKTTLGNNNVGTFVQKNGSGKVLLTGTLTGNYNQETSARTFVANAGNGNIATIDGNASFDSNVELENKLKITGNLELGNNATINIDFTKTYNVTGSVVDVDGTAAIAGNTNLNIEYWEPGTPKTYRLFTANQNVTGTFKSANVTFDNNAANNRQGFEIITTPDKKQLNLVTFTKNLDVTRTSGGKWSDPKWEFSETNKFCNGDYVTISTNNNDKNWELNIDIENGVETAGMKIENGNWTFSGNKIIGKEQTGNGAVTLINNDGQLNVTGKDTAATFKNAVKFEDINVTNNAKLHLPDDSPVETGTLKTESGTELSLKAVENKVTANGDVVLNGDVQFDYQITDPTKTETIKNVITTTNGTISGDFIAKVSNDKLLATTGAQLVGNNKLNFVYNPSSVNDFAKSHKLSGNMAQIGDLIDSQNYADSELLQQLYNLDPNDKEKFVQILFNQLGPELAANALQLSLWQPYEKVFNRLHEINESQSNNIQNNKVRGQLKERLNYELWFEGFYRGENVTHDNAAGDYKTTRGGLLTGVELQLDQTMRTGFFFSYSNPYVSSNIGRVEADDIVFGSYSHLQFGCNTALNASIAYGNQNYKYQHNYNRNNYNGDAMYASIELFRSAFWRNNWQLVPLFAVDFQKAWMKGFTTADTNQVVAKSTLGQTVLRIGLNSKFQPTDHIHFRTRLQYGIQVGGEVFSSVRTSYLNNPNQSRILTGVNLGRNMLNVGIGTDIYLSRTKRFRLFANYDFDFGERSTAHTGQFGFLTTW